MWQSKLTNERCEYEYYQGPYNFCDKHKKFRKEIISNALCIYVFLPQNMKDVPYRGESNPESRDQQVSMNKKELFRIKIKAGFH